ncbi:hypothetical protein quinque_002443 [Culex quinquefasciatus]
MKKRSASCIDQQGTIVDPLDLVPVFVLEHQKIVGGVKSIESTVRGVIQTEQDTRMCWELNEEGKLMKSSPNAKVGFSKAMSNGWIQIDSSGGAPLIKRKVDSIENVVQGHVKGRV